MSFNASNLQFVRNQHLDGVLHCVYMQPDGNTQVCWIVRPNWNGNYTRVNQKFFDDDGHELLAFRLHKD